MNEIFIGEYRDAEAHSFLMSIDVEKNSCKRELGYLKGHFPELIERIFKD